MPHKLMKRDDQSPWLHPLLVTLRYRCECATNEVLTIQLVLDKNIDESQFVWAMQRLFHDLKFEVEQHLTDGKPEQAAQTIDPDFLEALAERARIDPDAPGVIVGEIPMKKKK